MAMVQVYAEPFARRQYAPWVSHAVVYRILSWALTLLASAVIAFAAGGLWEKYSVAVSQPTVDFTYDMVVVLEGDASAGGGERVWTTSAAMNAALGPRLLAASVQVAADDENNDGKKDVFDIVWRGYGARAVTGVKVLTQYKYTFNDTVSLQMYSLAYAEHAGAAPGRGAYIDGQLRLVQDVVPAAKAVRTQYLSKPLQDPGSGTDTLQPTVESNLVRILASYHDRDEVTVLDSPTRVWQVGDSSEFVLQMRVRVPKAQEYRYKRDRLQVLLLAWVQILAIFYVLWWLVGRLSSVLFHFRVFRTRVASDLDKKLHHF